MYGLSSEEVTVLSCEVGASFTASIMNVFEATTLSTPSVTS